MRVAQNEEAGLVPAACTDGGERPHAERVDLLRAEDLCREALVLSRELDGVRRQRLRVQLVGRSIREVARAVRPRGDERRTLGRFTQLDGVEMAEHDPLDLAGRLLVARLPAPWRIAAEDRSFDEGARLVGEGDGERLVEEPADRAADPVERLRRGSRRSAQSIEVDVVARAD